jgi:hypothetical protein
MPVEHRALPLMLVPVVMFCAIASGCAHLEVIRLSTLPADTDQPANGTFLLPLTQPAWEVELNSGSPLTDERVRIRPVNIADPRHIYRVTLVPGFLALDKLILVDPRAPDLNLSCEDSVPARLGGGTLLVCPEIVAKGAEFPNESEILSRFQRSGQRIFIFIRPERSSLPLP